VKLLSIILSYIIYTRFHQKYFVNNENRATKDSIAAMYCSCGYPQTMMY